MRRNGGHFVLNGRADPQGAFQLVGLTRLDQNRLRFVADSHKTVAKVRGIEVVSAVVLRNPCGSKVLLQHGNPTVFGADVQVFVINDSIEFIFFVLRFRR